MTTGSGRFDYIKFDEVAAAKSAAFRRLFIDIETFIEANLAIDPNMPRELSGPIARQKAILFTKLEDAYGAVGRALRDEQRARNQSSGELKYEKGTT